MRNFVLKLISYLCAYLLINALSHIKTTARYRQQLNTVCNSETHGWGHFVPLENCHLFETEALKPYWKKGRKVFLCGGSLISTHWILTVAHCVTGYELRGSHVIAVRLGEWNIRTNPDFAVDIRNRRECAPLHIDILVDRILPHEDYDKLRRFADDIALLRLVQTVELSDFVKPICLPIAQEARLYGLVLEVAEVAGWGHTSVNTSQSLIKLKAMLTVRPLEICQMSYSLWRLKLDGKQLCAGGKPGVDTCRGDSDSPLLFETKNAHIAYFYVAGIVSFGRRNCGGNGQPAVYMPVGTYVNWINDKIREYS